MMLHLLLLVSLFHEPPPEDLPSVRERERAARLEVEAAQRGGFYFVVDVPAATLRFKLGGVGLEDFVLDDVSIGARLGTAKAKEALSALHTCEADIEETPVDIVPGEPIPELPSTAELPLATSLDCGPGLSIRVRALSATGVWQSLRERFLLPGEPEGARVRLVLPDDEYFKFFFALPRHSQWLFAPVLP